MALFFVQIGHAYAKIKGKMDNIQNVIFVLNKSEVDKMATFKIIHL